MPVSIDASKILPGRIELYDRFKKCEAPFFIIL